LCVAQAIMGIPRDRRFLKVVRKRLAHLFPSIPLRPAYFKRRRRLADQLEWLMAMFASQSPDWRGRARAPNPGQLPGRWCVIALGGAGEMPT
jgi:hypothetical protein